MNVTIEISFRKLHERLLRASALASVYSDPHVINDALREASEQIAVIEFYQSKVKTPPVPASPSPMDISHINCRCTLVENKELKDVPVGTFCNDNGTPAVWNGEEFEPVQRYIDDLGEELKGVREESNRKSAILEGIPDETSDFVRQPPNDGEVRIVKGLGICVWVANKSLDGVKWVRFRDHLVNLTEENKKLSSELEVEKQRGNGLAVDLASAVTGRDKYKAEESRLQKLLTECQNSRKDWQEKADAAHNREQRIIERAENAEGQLEAANSLIKKAYEGLKIARNYWDTHQPVGGQERNPFDHFFEDEAKS